MVAMTEVAEANGATKVIPGGHKWDNECCPEETEDAEMAQGAALLWKRTQYLSVPFDTLKEQPRTYSACLAGRRARISWAGESTAAIWSARRCPAAR